MLSTFERALLERHLRTCADCRAFSAEVTAQTAQLRAAPLVSAPEFAGIAGARARTFRRRATGLAGAVAVAFAAALISFTPAVGRRSAIESRVAPSPALLAAVPEQPTASASFELPRLKVISPSIADGAVRGYYGVPA